MILIQLVINEKGKLRTLKFCSIFLFRAQVTLFSNSNLQRDEIELGGIERIIYYSSGRLKCKELFVSIHCVHHLYIYSYSVLKNVSYKNAFRVHTTKYHSANLKLQRKANGNIYDARN
jgi:hypothetical protein